MEVGEVYYRRIDGQECKIKGFFFIHEDGMQSLIYENLSYLKLSAYEIYVLFHNDTYDSISNLFTNLYMVPDEYKKMQEYIQSFENADGLYSAMQITLDFPTLSVPDVTTLYELGSIESSQESHEWNEEDLVPNPGESKRKRFKLF